MTDVTAVAAPPLAEGMYRVELSRIRPAPDNIRQDLGDLSGLTDSIREKGVYEPLLVSTDGLIVFGHRRYAAACLARVVDVPIVVRDMSPAERFIAMLAENLQRQDITPLEEARGYQMLLSLGEETEAIAGAVGVRAGRVKQRVALLGLPRDVLEDLVAGTLTMGDALSLTRLNEQPEALAKVVKQHRYDDRSNPGQHRWYSLGYGVDEALKDIERDRKRQKTLAALPKGTKLLQLDSRGEPKKAGVLRVVATPPQYGYQRERVVILESKAHAKLACHALAVDRSGRRVELCTDPASHQAAPAQIDAAGEPVEAVQPIEPPSDYELARRAYDDLMASGEARREIEHLVARDPDCRDELYRSLVVCMTEDALGLPEGLTEEQIATYPDPPELIGLVALANLGYIPGVADAPQYNPFDENPHLARYYQLLRDHGYEMSGPEMELLSEATSPPERAGPAQPAPEAPTCRVCGCTDDHACEGGCSWVPDPEGGDLCSRCAAEMASAPAAEVAG